MNQPFYSSTFASFVIAFLVFLGTNNESIGPGIAPAPPNLIEKEAGGFSGNGIIEIYDTLPCESCQKYATDSLPAIRQKIANESLANLFVYLIPQEENEASHLGVLATKCASLQQKFWEAHTALHQLGEGINRKSVESIGNKLSLDMRMFKECLDTNPFAEQTKMEMQKATSKKIDQWPTTFANEYRLRGNQPAENIIHYIKKSLKRLTQNL